jgi:hypothetical protein
VCGSNVSACLAGIKPRIQTPVPPKKEKKKKKRKEKEIQYAHDYYLLSAV